MRTAFLRYLGRCAPVAACLALVSAPTVSVAQSGEERDEPMVLEEVVVTAQKREESLSDVPIAITAFTDAGLIDRGAVQLSDFLQSAPGVGIVDTGSGQQNIQIRGINSTFGNSPVGYYLDELPFTLVGNTQLPDVRTYDLQRIEVLRGPQGTLYGDGSLGGTIRVLTHDPDLGGFDANVDLTGSSTNDGGNNSAVRGMVNIPIAEDTAGLRFAVSEESYDGWIDNTSTGVEDQNERDISNYRGKFRWAPNDRLDVVLSAWHTDEDVVGDALSLDDRTTADPAPVYETDYDLYGATIRYRFDSFDLVSATSKMDYNADSVTWIAGLFDFTDLTQQDILSQELRLTSNTDGSFRWTAGLFYRDMDRQTTALLPAFAITQDLNLESESWAVFGETTWTVLDDTLDLTVGLRVFEDDRLYREEVDPALLALIQMIDPDFDGTVDETFDTVNPRFNASWRATDDWMFYANVAKGFRTGQPQPALSLGLAALFGVDIPSGIDPEELWSYEAGTKATLMDGRASFEAAVYYNDWDDLQVPVVVTPQVRALVNGGKARSQGIELGFSILPVQGLTLQFTGAYVDAEFTESVPGINIADGDRIPGVPEKTFSALGTYRWGFRDGMEWFANAAAQYTSERTDTLNLAAPSDSTTTVNLRFGLEGERWAGYLFADNVTDEDGAFGVYQLGPMGPAPRFRPRTLGVQLRWRY